MAKGQQRSNKEIRKPKKPKTPAVAENTFANQMKLSGNAGGRPAPQKKG